LKDLKFLQRGFPVWKLVQRKKNNIMKESVELRTLYFSAWPENEVHVTGGFFGTTICLEDVLLWEVNADMFYMNIETADTKVCIQFLEPYAFNCSWSVMALCSPQFVDFMKGTPPEFLFFTRAELREMTSDNDFRTSVLGKAPKEAKDPKAKAKAESRRANAEQFSAAQAAV